jgi:hypothetical protein
VLYFVFIPGTWGNDWLFGREDAPPIEKPGDAYCFNQGSFTVFAAIPSDVRRIGDAYQTATGDVY